MRVPAPGLEMSVASPRSCGWSGKCVHPPSTRIRQKGQNVLGKSLETARVCECVFAFIPIISVCGENGVKSFSLLLFGCRMSRNRKTYTSGMCAHACARFHIWRKIMKNIKPVFTSSIFLPLYVYLHLIAGCCLSAGTPYMTFCVRPPMLYR